MSGEFNAPKMWKLKNKLVKKSAGDIPTAKKDNDGNLITSQNLIKSYMKIHTLKG